MLTVPDVVKETGQFWHVASVQKVKASTARADFVARAMVRPKEVRWETMVVLWLRFDVSVSVGKNLQC